MASRRSIAALLYAFCLTSSCRSFMPTPTFSGQSFRNQDLLLGAAAIEDSESSSFANANVYEGNIFHEYDKPILLIGCSGEGGELERLARAFLTDNFETLSSDDYIVRLSDPTTGDMLISEEQLKEQIKKEYLKWPNVIVADFNDKAFRFGEGKYADTLEAKYTDIVRSLYEDEKILSIFVNVDSEKGKMDLAGSDRQSRLEDSIFVAYSDYEICIADEGTLEFPGSDEDEMPDEWEHIEWEMSRIVGRARLVPAVPGSKEPTTNTAHLTMGENTFFLSLSFPDITQVEPYVEQMCTDVDAMEYRTDLLDCRDSRFDLLYGMQLLRRYCRPFVIRVPALPVCGQVIEDVMPIVYTVRTQNQAGTYPDDELGISKMFDMLKWGLRAGVEVLDVESAWDKKTTDSLLSYAKERYSSQILGSHHVVGSEVSREEAVRLFQQCELDGRAHGAKVVLSIESEEKDRMAHEAAIIASSLAQAAKKPVIPNVSLILGDVGCFSRVVNLPFTPVTHESLPFKAAPGQMTSVSIMTARILTKIVRSKRFAILGHNIAYSVSPAMQGSAFAATQIPYQYGMADVETVEEFVESEFFNDALFGGCSVTIPHKQAIIPYVDVLSEAAETIGSVNTLVVKMVPSEEEFERVIYGDNTDWKGIFNPLERKLNSLSRSSKDFALILGGGGTARAAAYAATKLGLKLIYYNRTPSKVEELAEKFGGTVVTDIQSESESNVDSSGDRRLSDLIAASEGGEIKVVISTLPAAAEVTLPEWIIESKPVIFDVNYKPYETKLLNQAESSGCQMVRGSEMLWEQGVGQFELWTNRTAPYSVMKTVVLENCLPKDEDEMEEEDDSGEIRNVPVEVVKEEPFQ